MRLYNLTPTIRLNRNANDIFPENINILDAMQCNKMDKALVS